jgi:hypothetical protein
MKVNTVNMNNRNQGLMNDMNNDNTLFMSVVLHTLLFDFQYMLHIYDIEIYVI